MKKQITILIFVTLPLLSFSQNGIVKMTTLCTDEFVQNFHGRWLDYGAGPDPNLKISKQQQQEIFNRVNKIHQFVFDIYPSPVGFDAAHSWHTSDDQFAYQVKLEHLANGNTMESRINGIPVILYWYEAYFGRYSCVYNDNHKMLRGLPSEDVEVFFVYANKLTFLAGEVPLNIDGRKIQMMPSVKGMWKGYTLYYITYQGSAKTHVLLHRDGMLPYIPVTRKQFLDLAIPYIGKFYDDQVADLNKTPVRSIEEQEAIKNKTIEEYKKKYPGNPGPLKYYLDTYSTDQQELEKKKNIILKNKNDDLKKYQDELKRSTNNGMLESPAIVAGGIEMMSERPVFTTEEQGGNMLITENPNYFRKDLPKWVPQFFVLTFQEEGWSANQKNDAIKVVEKNFPVEQLQAMIDK